MRDAVKTVHAKARTNDCKFYIQRAKRETNFISIFQATDIVCSSGVWLSIEISRTTNFVWKFVAPKKKKTNCNEKKKTTLRISRLVCRTRTRWDYFFIETYYSLCNSRTDAIRSELLTRNFVYFNNNNKKLLLYGTTIERKKKLRKTY